MTNPSSAEPAYAHQDTELWQSLKHAISASSGFHRWRSEQLSALTAATSEDQLVRLYLRDTLETLAY